MASHAQSSREEQRSLSVRTLVIASVASAVAAVLTSLFWTRGTPIAAAITPVIVALVSELLHRPAEVISQRFTAETDALPEAAGAGPPPPRQARQGEPARDDAETAVEEGPAATAALRQATRERAAAARAPTQDAGNGGRPPRSATRETPPGVRVYGSGSGSAKRSLPWKPIALTAALAFVIGAGALTLPELIAGQSLGAGDRGTTYFGGGSSRADRDPDRGGGGKADEQAPARKPEQDPEAAPQDPAPDPDPEAEQSPAPEAKTRTAPEPKTTTTPPETVQETAPQPTTPTTPARPQQAPAP